VVLDAVAEAPPSTFSGGGKWEAMHDEMAGFYEIRIHGAGMDHRRMRGALVLAVPARAG